MRWRRLGVGKWVGIWEMGCVLCVGFSDMAHLSVSIGEYRVGRAQVKLPHARTHFPVGQAISPINVSTGPKGRTYPPLLEFLPTGSWVIGQD